MIVVVLLRCVVGSSSNHHSSSSIALEVVDYTAYSFCCRVSPHFTASKKRLDNMAPIALYRSLLREAKRMNDYNFRMYAIRRVKTDFQTNRSLQGEQATAALMEAEEQLAMLRRQVVLGKMYPSGRSVMD